MRKFFLLSILVSLSSFTGTSLKKRISDTLYRYEFYTTSDIVRVQPERQYYWFKGGSIHNSEYGIAGELLHDEFLKFYHSNQLAESGKYKYGLKEGYWKTWYKDGTLQTKSYWSDGQMDGSYYAYDNTGFLVEEGYYKNNKKNGRWINYISDDTLKYINGKIIPKKITDTLNIKKGKPGFLKRIFMKKGKQNKNGDDKAQTTEKSIKTNPEREKKAGFFRRLFYSKEKTNSKGEVKELKETKSATKDKPDFFGRIFKRKSKKENNND
jgi:hypothetical protein